MSHLYPPSQNNRPNVIDNVVDNVLAFYNLPEVNLATTKVGTLTFTTRGPSGTGMYVDWGDGSALEWIAHLGTSTNVATPHVYAGAGTKNIKFTGRLDLVTYFRCNDGTLSGDIGGLSVLTNVTYVHFANTSISGDIGELDVLTNITNMYLANTSVSGDIGKLYTLTNIVEMSMLGTSVSGDIGELYTLTNITLLYLIGTSMDYSSATLPAWSNANLQIYSCTLNSTEVDNFLIDLAAAGGTNGTLNIAGTNAARTSASDSAKATLLTNGWVITVNE